MIDVLNAVRKYGVGQGAWVRKSDGPASPLGTVASSRGALEGLAIDLQARRRVVRQGRQAPEQPQC